MNLLLYLNFNCMYVAKICYHYYRFMFCRSFDIYIGNLSCHTIKSQIYKSTNINGIKKIITGVQKYSKKQSDFVFLKFYTFKKTKSLYEKIPVCKINQKIPRGDLNSSFSNKRRFKRK